MSDKLDNTEIEDFNPFEAEVVDKPYTKDFIKASVGDIPEEELIKDIPEATYDSPPIDDDLVDVEEEQEPHGLDKNVDGLSENEKRKKAEATADALLKSYQTYVPLIFTSIASFNMRKVVKLDKAGKIRLNMKVADDGTTVQGFIERYNGEIFETLQVTNAMVDEIREPLIGVLMENNLVLSNMQQLLLGVGGHIVQLGFSTIKLIQSKQDMLDEFIDFKEKEDKRIRGGYSRDEEVINPQENQEESNKDVENTTNDNSGSEEEYSKPTITLDDVLEDKIATEENGGIIIENYETE